LPSTYTHSVERSRTGRALPSCSFVPPGRDRSVYVGRSPAGRPADLTFGFRPVRHDYFHEKPEAFEQPGLLYHPVKPGVPTWTRDTKNVRRP